MGIWVLSKQGRSVMRCHQHDIPALVDWPSCIIQHIVPPSFFSPYVSVSCSNVNGQNCQQPPGIFQYGHSVRLSPCLKLKQTWLSEDFSHQALKSREARSQNSPTWWYQNFATPKIRVAWILTANCRKKSEKFGHTLKELFRYLKEFEPLERVMCWDRLCGKVPPSRRVLRARLAAHEPSDVLAPLALQNQRIPYPLFSGAKTLKADIMIQARLNDAAICMFKILNDAGVKHGIFGGYALGALGAPRESKDIDCIASVSKPQVISIMNGKEGFVYIDQSCEDYVAFFWSDNKERTEAVLVEIFVSSFPGKTDGNINLGREFPSDMLRCFSGAQFGMQGVEPLIKTVPGQTQGSGSIAHLDPALIFKGKLRAAATRAKFHDSSDLRWLEARYRSLTKQKKSLFSLQYIGLALKRYPELHLVFHRLELDIEAASSLVQSQNPSNLPPPQRGDVQKGLLGM